MMCSYEIARNFRPPGRLMFLRPVKTAPQEKASRRTYDTVWITAEVRAATQPSLWSHNLAAHRGVSLRSCSLYTGLLPAREFPARNFFQLANSLVNRSSRNGAVWHVVSDLDPPKKPLSDRNTYHPQQNSAATTTSNAVKTPWTRLLHCFDAIGSDTSFAPAVGSTSFPALAGNARRGSDLQL